MQLNQRTVSLSVHNNGGLAVAVGHRLRSNLHSVHYGRSGVKRLSSESRRNCEKGGSKEELHGCSGYYCCGMEKDNKLCEHSRALRQGDGSEYKYNASFRLLLQTASRTDRWLVVRKYSIP